MPQKHTYRLVVAFAFDAACGKAMTQAMEFQQRKIELLHKSPIMVAIATGLGGMRRVCQDVKASIDDLLKRLDEPLKFFS